MRGRDTSARGADIQGFGQLDESRPKRVRSPQKDGDLDTNAGGLPLLCDRHRALVFQKLTGHMALVWSRLVLLT